MKREDWVGFADQQRYGEMSSERCNLAMRDRIYIETITQFTRMLMQTIAFALITIAFIAAGFFVWFFTFKAKQEERRFLIEKGYRLEDLPRTTSSKIQIPWMKVGIVLTLAAIGFLFALITGEAMAIMPLLIFGAGLGMIIAQAIENGFRIRTLWKKIIFGLLGFGIGGLTATWLQKWMFLDSESAVFYVIFCFALALFIENRTSKSTEIGE
jgi:hypothetical protein